MLRNCYRKLLEFCRLNTYDIDVTVINEQIREAVSVIATGCQTRTYRTTIVSWFSTITGDAQFPSGQLQHVVSHANAFHRTGVGLIPTRRTVYIKIHHSSNICFLLTVAVLGLFLRLGPAGYQPCWVPSRGTRTRTIAVVIFTMQAA